MADATTIYAPHRLIDDLDVAAEQIFGTNDVAHRVTIERLIEDHDDVDIAAYDEREALPA